MRFIIARCLWSCVALLGWTGSAFAQDYDLLLRGGHVIDAKNGVKNAKNGIMAHGGNVDWSSWAKSVIG